MSQYNPLTTVNIGGSANDGTGDNIRAAFQKVNNNFSYLGSYTITTITNDMIVTPNQGYKKIVLTGVGTISNIWINLPSTASDGQELKITSMVPITTCWVNQNKQNIQWLSNSAFSSGNVTTNLTYTTTNSSWMTF